MPVRVTGPLASHMQGYCAALVGVGYTPQTARDHGYVPAHLSRWLDSEGLDPAGLTPAVLDRFLSTRRGENYRRGLSARSLRALLDYLRGAGVVPAAPAPAAEDLVEELLGIYSRYLLGVLPDREERGRPRPVPGPPLRRLVPPRHPRDARPRLPLGHHGDRPKRAGHGLIPLTLAELRRLLAPLIHIPARVLRRAWSIWRRRHQHRARESHYRRRRLLS